MYSKHLSPRSFLTAQFQNGIFVSKYTFSESEALEKKTAECGGIVKNMMPKVLRS
jgi:hypothetical protein